MLNRYLPYVIGGIILVIFVVGVSNFGQFLSSPNPPASASDGAPPAVEAVAQPTSQPAQRQTSQSYVTSDDPMVVTLSGQFSNGGYWGWADIMALLGVYDVAGNFQTVTVNEVTYEGVPLSYLLDFARLNDTANVVEILSRHSGGGLYYINGPQDVSDYLIAMGPDDHLILIMPEGNGYRVLDGVSRITTQGTPSVQSGIIPMPPHTDSVVLLGEFRQGGNWTWEDMTNLLGTYGALGQYATVTIDEVTYTGVPAGYLLDFAGPLNPRAEAFTFYNRAGERVTSYISYLKSCMECIIARMDDGTLSLVQPGLSPEVLPQVAVARLR